MRHRLKGRKLNRTASHRKAMMSNMAVSLIKNKKIRTTVAKAKELRGYIESLISKSKNALYAKYRKAESGVHLRRQVNSFLNDRIAVKTLFEEIAPKVEERPGGYTRVLKMGRRFGDAAEIALIELVDYNVEQADQKSKEKSTAAETKTSAKKRTKKVSAKEKSPKRKKKKTEDVSE